MITPFIEDKLCLKDMEIFLDHVNSCKNCREELEIYYALLTAMKQLDEDKNLSGDFEQELVEKLEKAQEKILHKKYAYYRKKAVLVIMVAFLAFLISIGYSNRINVNLKQAIVSDFRLRKVFIDHRNDIIDIQLQNYMKEYGLSRISVIE
jgi:hypothetical protein